MSKGVITFYLDDLLVKEYAGKNCLILKDVRVRLNAKLKANAQLDSRFKHTLIPCTPTQKVKNLYRVELGELGLLNWVWKVNALGEMYSDIFENVEPKLNIVLADVKRSSIPKEYYSIISSELLTTHISYTAQSLRNVKRIGAYSDIHSSVVVTDTDARTVVFRHKDNIDLSKVFTGVVLNTTYNLVLDSFPCHDTLKTNYIELVLQKYPRCKYSDAKIASFMTERLKSATLKITDVNVFTFNILDHCEITFKGSKRNLYYVGITMPNTQINSKWLPAILHTFGFSHRDLKLHYKVDNPIFNLGNVRYQVCDLASDILNNNILNIPLGNIKWGYIAADCIMVSGVNLIYYSVGNHAVLKKVELDLTDRFHIDVALMYMRIICTHFIDIPLGDKKDIKDGFSDIYYSISNNKVILELGKERRMSSKIAKFLDLLLDTDAPNYTVTSELKGKGITKKHKKYITDYVDSSFDVLGNYFVTKYPKELLSEKK